MLSLLLATLLTQATMSPTSDLSTNRVRATDTSVTRALRDRFGEVLNVKDFGALGNATWNGVTWNGTDDTVAIQTALNHLPTDPNLGPAVLEFPTGVYIVSTQLSRDLLQYAVIRARGNVTLVWKGADATKSIFRFNAGWRITIEGFKFRVGAGYRAAAAVTFGSYLGQHTISHNDVYGETDRRFDAGFVMNSDAGDANNDHHLFQHNRCAYVVGACVDIHGTQSKAHKLIGNVFTSSQYGVASEGSFYWYGGALAGNSKCDFWQKTPLNSDPIVISGVNSEESKRLYCGGANGFTAEGNVATSNTTNENQFPVTIEGVRFDTRQVDVDGLESTAGGNMQVKFSTTADELDGAHGTVGWFAPVVNSLGGPLVLIGNRFGTYVPLSGARRAKVVSVASTLGEHVMAIGNVFIGDDPSISAIYGTRGGLVYGPYLGTQEITALSNLMFKSGTWSGGGLDQVKPMAGQIESTGRSFWAATEWDGWYGGTYAIRTIKDHHRIKLGADITSLTAPDGVSPGQLMTLEFMQDASAVFKVSGWGSNLALASGAFLAPAANASASITFRWDPIISKWVEIARSGVSIESPFTTVADGASAVGFVFDTSNAFTTAGSKLISVRNASAEKMWLGYNGYLYTEGHMQTGGQIYAAETIYSSVGDFWSNGAVRASIAGNAADGGTAVGVIVNNRTTLSTAGAKVLSVQNNGSEKLAVDLNGGVVQTGVTFSSLGTPANGTLIYCSDCAIGATCAGSGTGAFAKRLNGAWVCN